MGCPGCLLRGEWGCPGWQVGVGRVAPSAGGAWPGGGGGRASLLAEQEHSRQDWGADSVMPCGPLTCHLSLFSFLSSGEPPPTTSAPTPASCQFRACQEGCRHLPLTGSGPGAGEAPLAFPDRPGSPRNVVDSGAELCWALALGVAASGGKRDSLGPHGAGAAYWLEGLGGKVSGAPRPCVSPPRASWPQPPGKAALAPPPPLARSCQLSPFPACLTFLLELHVPS